MSWGWGDSAIVALGLVFGFILMAAAREFVKRVTRVVALHHAVKFMSINGTNGNVLNLAAEMESYIARGRVTR